MKPTARLILLALSLTLFGGCAQYHNQRGVDVAWDTAVMQQLSRGSSTRADVLDLLGPPSQVIALQGESAMYYLFERSTGKGLVLVLYNRVTIDTQYDRAIFFFDENDVLTEFSTRVYRPDA